MFVDLVRKTENEKIEKGQGEKENQEFKQELFLRQCTVFCTLLFSVATVALMLFAEFQIWPSIPLWNDLKISLADIGKID